MHEKGAWAKLGRLWKDGAGSKLGRLSQQAPNAVTSSQKSQSLAFRITGIRSWTQKAKIANSAIFAYRDFLKIVALLKKRLGWVFLRSHPGGSLERTNCFLNRAKLCDTGPVIDVGALETLEDFRRINVQWIGQWGLFSRCGDSWTQ